MGINSKKEPGYYADGGGLYLRISQGGTKGWIFRFMLRGRAREMGLGSVRDKTLTQARDDAAKCRQLLLDGIDPITHRDPRGKHFANRRPKNRAKYGHFRSVPQNITRPTATGGATPSMRNNGSVRWPTTPSLYWATRT
ncbi:Arm DNA-binding domain-containing protein [Pseudoduganella sp. RAF53_2]|uniref:Arm DNA-binding domain-containing protein n=1 Tax=Pseudoduganella sp. RAF53_2 TaxID=3233060 RepID=UPI003F9AE035